MNIIFLPLRSLIWTSSRPHTSPTPWRADARRRPGSLKRARGVGDFTGQFMVLWTISLWWFIWFYMDLYDFIWIYMILYGFIGVIWWFKTSNKRWLRTGNSLVIYVDLLVIFDGIYGWEIMKNWERSLGKTTVTGNIGGVHHQFMVIQWHLIGLSLLSWSIELRNMWI